MSDDNCCCSCCGDCIELGDVFDILSLVVSKILGMKIWIEKIKKSNNRFWYALSFRIFCFLVGVGIDIGLLYYNYPYISWGNYNQNLEFPKNVNLFMSEEVMKHNNSADNIF